MAGSRNTIGRLPELRDYLGSFDLFAGKEEEGAGYLRKALRRVVLTFDLLARVPGDQGQLLELGANPYFLTLLLKRHTRYELTLANYFGGGVSPDRTGVQVITSARHGEQHEFRYDHFNCERDAFPYASQAFDVVLNCEILEHLTEDPVRVLGECRRVLKPGGYLLLTTPNVLAFKNLSRLFRGKNIYDSYSGYGPYGRHNREYTLPEVRALLKGCGFTPEHAYLRDIYRHDPLVWCLKRIRGNWRDAIFVLARADGTQTPDRYPQWLYRSVS